MTTFDDHLDAATDDLVTGLHHYIGRLHRNNPHLRLEQENQHWLVVDTANPSRYDDETVMIRVPTWQVAYRFLVAFIFKHPETTVDEVSVEATRAIAAADTTEHSVKVPPERPKLRLVV